MCQILDSTPSCGATQIKLHPTYCPEHKPHVERFFRTLNTELWSEQPGYTGSSVAKRNPTAEKDATLTIAILEARFWKFINTKYHVREHSTLGMSPLAFWDENCFTEAPDVRQLDVLMMEPEQRKITKGRISLDNRLYFHPELATLVGEHVVVRRTTHYGSPDSIEVFNNGLWICTAVAIDSDLADAISGKDVREGQKAQRRDARQQIKAAKQRLKEDDQEAGEPQGEDSGVADQKGGALQDASSTSDANTSGQTNSVTPATPEDEQGTTPPDSESKPTARSAKPQGGSFLQRLGRQAKERQQEGDSHA